MEHGAGPFPYPILPRAKPFYARTSVRSEKKARPRLTLGIRFILTFLIRQCLMTEVALNWLFPILYNPLPNPNITIRNCCAAVTALRCAEMVARDVAAVDVNMGCPKLFSTHGGMVCSDCSCGPSSHTTAYGMLAHTIDNPPHPMTRGRSC